MKDNNFNYGFENKNKFHGVTGITRFTQRISFLFIDGYLDDFVLYYLNYLVEKYSAKHFYNIAYGLRRMSYHRILFDLNIR